MIFEYFVFLLWRILGVSVADVGLLAFMVNAGLPTAVGGVPADTFMPVEMCGFMIINQDINISRFRIIQDFHRKYKIQRRHSFVAGRMT